MLSAATNFLACKKEGIEMLPLMFCMCLEEQTYYFTFLQISLD